MEVIVVAAVLLILIIVFGAMLIKDERQSMKEIAEKAEASRINDCFD